MFGKADINHTFFQIHTLMLQSFQIHTNRTSIVLVQPERQAKMLFDSSSSAKHTVTSENKHTQMPFSLLWFLIVHFGSFVLHPRWSSLVFFTACVGSAQCCLHLHVVLYATVTDNIVCELFSGKLGFILFFCFSILDVIYYCIQCNLWTAARMINFHWN